jgi:diguanylate cyclase
VLAKNPAASIGRLHEIQQLGVQICIDDFGAGESVFRHLGRMPADSLKIDRGLIDRLMSSTADQALVAGIVSLAQGLNLANVAKGIETEEQRRFLRRLGCDRLQGRLLGAPAPPAATEQLLRTAQPGDSLNFKPTSSELNVIEGF